MPAPVLPNIGCRLLVAIALFVAGASSSFHALASDDGDRFDAISAYDEGRYEDALAAIERAKHSSSLAYLRIRVLAELGRFGEALDQSREPDKAWPAAVVRDLAELRVSWAASAGRCDAVIAQGKGSPSRAAERLVARCAFAAKQFAEVKLLLAGAKDAEGRSLYIRALIELGERAAAVPLARAFYVEYPAHRDSELLQRFLEGEGGPLVLSLDERLRRAEGLLSARQPDLAYAELSEVPTSKDKKLEARLWHLRGESLFRTRKRYPEANKAFEHAAKLGGETEDYDVFHAARATSRAGDDRTAIKEYRAFAARYKKSKLTPDALFLAAWLSAREKLPSASADLKSFVVSKYATQAPGLRRDALWELGFHAFQKHVPKEANKWLGEYERAVKDPLERARAVYWQGRTALLEKDAQKARALFTRALREDRLGWYAQLAARRLIALGEPPPRAFEAAPSPLPRPAVKAVPEEVRFYHDLGLYSEAADAASRFLGPEPDRARRAAVLSEAGEANRLFVAAEPLFDRALEGPASGPRAWIWDALLPKPYWRVVREQTERQGLDPALFYGHMQVESHYKARAVSSADALGLMQLLPETALTVAKSLGIDSDRSRLMRPHLNIMLGAAYLSGLIKQYDGQFPMAIAAYNAGTHKVDEWTGKKEVELDIWVETIPVEQTRNYVRRVVTAWSRYHALTTPDDAWGLPLPEKVRLHTQ
ncbi:MAG: Soluble lytic murein transglycosylase precursor [Myxococcaceae bacterium]|nr:Soluble lytic murein transglycosylase precursor [Myxococcaceae bacterium]